MGRGKRTRTNSSCFSLFAHTFNLNIHKNNPNIYLNKMLPVRRFGGSLVLRLGGSQVPCFTGSPVQRFNGSAGRTNRFEPPV